MRYFIFALIFLGMCQGAMAKDRHIYLECKIDGIKADKICDWVFDALQTSTTANVTRYADVDTEMVVAITAIRTTGISFDFIGQFPGGVPADIRDLRLTIRDKRLDQTIVASFVERMVEKLDVFDVVRH